jgi:hypothetical protein
VSAGAEVAARNRLTPIPTAIRRARAPGVGIVTVVDIEVSSCRLAGVLTGLIRKTTRCRDWFPHRHHCATNVRREE